MGMTIAEIEFSFNVRLWKIFWNKNCFVGFFNLFPRSITLWTFWNLIIDIKSKKSLKIPKGELEAENIKSKKSLKIPKGELEAENIKFKKKG